MSRTTLIAVGTGTFLTGLLLGVLAGHRWASPEVSPTSVQGSLRQNLGKVMTGSPSVGRSGTKEAQEEILRLRQRVTDLEARLGRVPPSEDEVKKADEIYKHLKNPKIDEDSKGFMKAMGLLADLRPTMTPIFAGKFRTAKPQYDSIALELALASGGPEATVLLKEILGSPTIQKGERVGVGISLTGDSYLRRLGTSIPVDPELASLGESCLALTNPYERLAGVGVLELQRTDQSRSALQGLAVQDKDEPIRVAALNALGRIGDRSTLEYLRSYAVSSFPDLFEESELGEGKPPSAKGALLQALRQLSQRFPE